MKKFFCLILVVLFILYPSIIYVSAQDNNNSYIINAPYIKQYPDWPTGCESVTTTMALQYYGFNITVAEFVDNYLPRGPYPYYDENNVRVGSNPWICFPGDPAGTGYGVFSPVIEKSVNSYLKDTTYKAVSITEQSLEQLCIDYIDNDIPIILWATSETVDSKGEALITSCPGSSWVIYDTGDIFTWSAYEHCILLVGYDENYYYFNNPSRGKLRRYTRKSVEASYKSVFSQAVVILPNNNNKMYIPPTVYYNDIVLGDLDKDGKINALDLIKLRNYLKGSNNFTENELKAADVNFDGIISMIDYLKLKRHFLGTYSLDSQF